MTTQRHDPTPGRKRKSLRGGVVLVVALLILVCGQLALVPAAAEDAVPGNARQPLRVSVRRQTETLQEEVSLSHTILWLATVF